MVSHLWYFICCTALHKWRIFYLGRLLLVFVFIVSAFRGRIIIGITLLIKLVEGIKCSHLIFLFFNKVFESTEYKLLNFYISVLFCYF